MYQRSTIALLFIIFVDFSGETYLRAKWCRNKNLHYTRVINTKGTHVFGLIPLICIIHLKRVRGEIVLKMRNCCVTLKQ